MRDLFRPVHWTASGTASWAILGTVLATVFGLLAWPAPCQAAAPIELRPEQLTIHAERGDTVTRTIQLRLNEDLLNLRAQPMELLSERHDSAVPVAMPCSSSKQPKRRAAGMSSSRTACPAFVRCPPSIIVVPMVRSPVDTMNACHRATDRAAPVRLARCFPRPLPRL